MSKNKRKHLTARHFCEIVLSKEKVYPRYIEVRKRKYKEITLLFGWFETIQKNLIPKTKISIVLPKMTKALHKMKVTEKELLSLLALWEAWKVNSSILKQKLDEEQKPQPRL